MTNSNNNLGDKICAIVAHGSSLNILEERIEEFKNLDNIVWCGMNFFNPSEEILKKIGKQFDIVFDCSTIPESHAKNYELMRITRLTEYLNRNKNNIYITLKAHLYLLREELTNELGYNFNERYKDQIIYGEDLNVPTHDFYVSLPLFITILAKLCAKKIILFGADGGGANINIDTSGKNTYYKSGLAIAERIASGIDLFDLTSDNKRVNNSDQIIREILKEQFPEITNCSPDSNYNIWNKKSYDETISYIKLNG